MQRLYVNVRGTSFGYTNCELQISILFLILFNRDIRNASTSLDNKKIQTLQFTIHEFRGYCQSIKMQCANLNLD